MYNLDCSLRSLFATLTILIQCDIGNDGRRTRPVETHKRSPDPAWVEGVSGKSFREGDPYMERNRNKLAPKAKGYQA